MVKLASGRLAALDIGSAKIACYIADASGDDLNIRGIGHQLSQGCKAGVITNMKMLENSILAAVHQAEQMAGCVIDKVTVNLSSALVKSEVTEVETFVPGGRVSERELSRISNLAADEIGDTSGQIIHSFPFDYSLDDITGIASPEGMVGKTLSARVHLSIAPKSLIRNFEACLASCQLKMDLAAVSAYASGLATINEDEMEVGTTVIDMGAATTSFATFMRGRMVSAGVVPMGGMHITSDISKGLSTSIASAERVKALYGSAIAGHYDEFENVEVESNGFDSQRDTHIVPRLELVNIISPRAEEIMEITRDKLKSSQWFGAAGGRIVLTGGASQLTGTLALAERIFGSAHIRIARPKLLKGAAEATSSPVFATCAGLLLHKQRKLNEQENREKGEPLFKSTRAYKWFVSNF